MVAGLTCAVSADMLCGKAATGADAPDTLAAGAACTAFATSSSFAARADRANSASSPALG